MVRSVPEEYFVKWSSLEGTDICAADSNWTWGLCHHHDYYNLQFLLFFGGYSEPHEETKTQGSSGGVFVYCYVSILVNVEILESAGDFKTENLGYIISIFEDNSDSRFHLWASQKYKEVMEFVKKPLLCDKYVIQTDDIIIYGLLVQGYLR